MTTHFRSFSDAQLAARNRNKEIREQCSGEHFAGTNRQPAQPSLTGPLIFFAVTALAVLALLWKAWPL